MSATFLVEKSGGVAAVLVRANEFVFGGGDGSTNGVGIDLFSGEAEVGHDFFDGVGLVGGVVDDEVVGIAQMVDLAAEDAGADGVEGADPGGNFDVRRATGDGWGCVIQAFRQSCRRAICCK